MKSKIVVVDDFLVSSCLEKLRNYALSATVWHSTKVGGYLGTYIYDGFTPSVLHMLARELEEALPKVFDYGRHSLEMAWAYKYYFDGIKLHVDEAAVNANFWLSETLENNPQRGGIVIFREEPPKGTPRSIYNNAAVNHHRIRQKLELNGHGKVEVEHRQNRLGKFCFSFCRREFYPLLTSIGMCVVK